MEIALDFADPVLARSSLAEASIRNGSVGGRTARCAMPRTRRRNTRTSSIRISTAPIAAALWTALRDVVLFWVGAGRAHLPRRQPAHQAVPVLGMADPRGRRRAIPDVIFLSEAFTRPKVMKALAKLGFTQSYTYFTWRTTKARAERLSDRADAVSGARVFPAELLRQHAGHPSRFTCRRASAWMFKIARRARRHAVVQLRRLQRLRAAASTSRSRARRNTSIPRNTRSRRATGTSPATSRTTSAALNRLRRENPALLQTRDSALCRRSTTAR